MRTGGWQQTMSRAVTLLPAQLHFCSLGFIIFLYSEMYSMTANTIQCSYAVVNHAISQFIKLNIVILCKMQL